MILHRRGLTYNFGEGLDGGQVFEPVGVGDLAGGPLALVGGVVDEGGVPCALVLGVSFEGTFPFTAARCIGALGVGDSGCDPVTIFLVVPLFRLFGV